MLALAVACSDTSRTPDATQEPLGADNLAYRWGQVALDATARDTDRFNPRPTITSRYLALVFISVFDAWSRYDAKATPVYLAGIDRRPSAEHTLRNKEVAISYAAYRTLKEYYYSDAYLFRDFMIDLGLDPSDASDDPSTPTGIGNLAAQAVIEARRDDGSNQYGTAEGSNGVPYFDYTRYKPANSPDENVDLYRWQPKYFSSATRGRFAPACLTPHWGLVKPIALKSGDQKRPGPPPPPGSEQLRIEVQEVVDMQANLTDEQKALVEFMRDGPSSVQQAGHWLIFAQNMSVRDNHTLDDDVKMYFLNQVAAMDAFIAAWDAKMYYDYGRPMPFIHEMYKGQTIIGWAGPEHGWAVMKGEEWRPYSPDDFLCPPFPAYVSGHSCASGACSEALRLFKGSDAFGESVKLVPGIMTEPENAGDTVTLYLPTLSATAEMAGISRVLGGYHIQADNIEGLELGRRVAREVYAWYQGYVGEE